MIEKFLYQPVKPFQVSQYFGEDRACLSKLDGRTVIAKETNATCPPYFRSLYSFTNGHNGLDIPAYRWQPVYAAHSGIVTEKETEPARGLGIGIVSDEERFFSEAGKKLRYKTRYWHFIALNADFGERVSVGDLIGYADNTGYSGGDHLHFELKPVEIIAIENGVPVVKNALQNNTHLGAISPLPYMETIFALDFGGLVRKVKELLARITDLFGDLLRDK